jgi:hypothetical protein
MRIGTFAEDATGGYDDQREVEAKQGSQKAKIGKAEGGRFSL